MLYECATTPFFFFFLFPFSSLPPSFSFLFPFLFKSEDVSLVLLDSVLEHLSSVCIHSHLVSWFWLFRLWFPRYASAGNKTLPKTWVAAYWLLPYDFLSLLFCSVQDHHPGVTTPTRGWALLHQSLIQEMSYRLVCSLTFWRHFLSWGSFSDDSNFCQNDIKTNSTEFLTIKEPNVVFNFLSIFQIQKGTPEVDHTRDCQETSSVGHGLCLRSCITMNGTLTAWLGKNTIP